METIPQLPTRLHGITFLLIRINTTGFMTSLDKFGRKCSRKNAVLKILSFSERQVVTRPLTVIPTSHHCYTPLEPHRIPLLMAVEWSCDTKFHFCFDLSDTTMLDALISFWNKENGLKKRIYCWLPGSWHQLSTVSFLHHKIVVNYDWAGWLGF